MATQLPLAVMNKKATDLGVLGLAYTKAALDAKYGPPVSPTMQVDSKDGEDFTSRSWGKETPEEIEKKGKCGIWK